MPQPCQFCAGGNGLRVGVAEVLGPRRRVVLKLAACLIGPVLPRQHRPEQRARGQGQVMSRAQLVPAGFFRLPCPGLGLRELAQAKLRRGQVHADGDNVDSALGLQIAQLQFRFCVLPLPIEARGQAAAEPPQRMLALRGGIEFAYRVPRGQLSFGMQTAPVQCNEQVIDRSGPVVVRAPARRQLPAALDSRRPDILLLVEIASMNLVSSSTASPPDGRDIGILRHYRPGIPSASALLTRSRRSIAQDSAGVVSCGCVSLEASQASGCRSQSICGPPDSARLAFLIGFVPEVDRNCSSAGRSGAALVTAGPSAGEQQPD
jgi:hypothetical protein